MKLNTFDEFINEERSGKGLNIYRCKDGTYNATANGILYSFMWNSNKYIVYNFKKIGTVSDFYKLGELVHKPHIQMILQVQTGINSYK
jgi:hypothetical protein